MLITPQKAIKELKKGNFLILIDSLARENEGDLVCAAQTMTAEKMNFMITHGRGLVNCPLTPKIAKKLQLPLMVSESKNEENTKCNFTVSVDARTNITTGISANDRAVTVQALASKKSSPKDLVRPGHIFPIVSHPRGLKGRQGHTEATIEILKMAGMNHVGVMCEIIKNDGSMARRPNLLRFAKKHKIKMLLIKDVLHINKKRNIQSPIKNSEYKNIKKIRLDAKAKLPTRFGLFKILVFRSLPDNLEHVVISMGNLQKKKNVLIRVHSECFTGDCAFSQKCDCGEQLEMAMQRISKEKLGAVIYLNQEGRGIGLTAKIQAYALQDKGLDTAQANEALGFKIDERDMWVGAEIFRHYHISSIRLMTNNPQKISALKQFGIKNITRVPLEAPINKHNKKYLQTKKEKMGHLLS